MRAARRPALQLPPREKDAARPPGDAAAGRAPHPRRARPGGSGSRARQCAQKCGARGRNPRLHAARPRPRRAHGLALSRLAPARRPRPARDERAGGTRAVGRPCDDEPADDPGRATHRLPRARRRQGRGRGALVRRRDQRCRSRQPLPARRRAGRGVPRRGRGRRC